MVVAAPLRGATDCPVARVMYTSMALCFFSFVATPKSGGGGTIPLPSNFDGVPIANSSAQNFHQFGRGSLLRKPVERLLLNVVILVMNGLLLEMIDQELKIGFGDAAEEFVCFFVEDLDHD